MRKYQFLIYVDLRRFILQTFQNSVVFLLRFGQPSVEKPVRLSHFRPRVSMEPFSPVNRSLPVVIPLTALLPDPVLF